MTTAGLIDDLSLRNRAYHLLYALGADPKTVRTLEPGEAESLVLLAQSVDAGSPDSLSGFWIIQRCTQKSTYRPELPGAACWQLEYEDFPVPEGLLTRDQMITVLDRVGRQNQDDEFRGHRLTYREIAEKVKPHHLKYVATGRV